MKIPENSRRSPLRPRGAARVIPEVPQESGSALVEHPDGWYWLPPGGRQQVGPFTTRDEALANRDLDDEFAPATGETLQEAEAELGLDPWVDPETGELDERSSRPHLSDS